VSELAERAGRPAGQVSGSIPTSRWTPILITAGRRGQVPSRRPGDLGPPAIASRGRARAHGVAMQHVEPAPRDGPYIAGATRLAGRGHSRSRHPLRCIRIGGGLGVRYEDERPGAGLAGHRAHRRWASCCVSNRAGIWSGGGSPQLFGSRPAASTSCGDAGMTDLAASRFHAHHEVVVAVDRGRPVRAGRLVGPSARAGTSSRCAPSLVGRATSRDSRRGLRIRDGLDHHARPRRRDRWTAGNGRSSAEETRET
jgi:hypothetical protein